MSRAPWELLRDYSTADRVGMRFTKAERETITACAAVQGVLSVVHMRVAKRKIPLTRP